MRIKIRLNQETKLLLEFYKEEYIKKGDYNFSYSLLVSNIIKELKPNIDKIDWELVKSINLKDLQKNDCTLSVTTFTLTASAEDILKEIQKIIRKDFRISRVYSSFAIKISLKAHYLKEFQKLDIFKK